MTALTGALLVAAPQEAEACGGFFCDGGPQPMPVDQTGEDILFVMDQGQVVEQGKHDELVALDGLYAHLAALQFDQAV